MAGAGYRNWSPGDIPTATQFDTFLQEQTVMNFADASARDTALSVVKAEGMVAYLRDVNLFTQYDGAAWVPLAPFFKFASAAARDSALSGVLSEGLFAFLVDANTLTVYTGSAWSTEGPIYGQFPSVTPVVTQGATPTLTNTLSDYTRFGRLIVGQCRVAITGAGTASNPIAVSGFPACVAGVDVIGTGYILDSSVPTPWAVRAYFVSTTSIQFHKAETNVASALSTLIMGSGSNAMTAALASGDLISFNFAYEAGVDA